MSSWHAKAVEAAYRSRFGKDPDHADKVSGVIFSRDELRRAIAAFLRETARTGPWITKEMADRLWSIADELEQP